MLGDNGYVGGFACAAKCGKSIDAMEYHSHSGPSIALFSYLGHNVGDFLLTGKAPAPLERTYLTTGVLEAAMISHGNGGKVVHPPGDPLLRVQTRAGDRQASAAASIPASIAASATFAACRIYSSS